MSEKTADGGNEIRFGRAAGKIGTWSVVVRIFSIFFLFFLFGSREGYGQGHGLGAFPAVMGLSILGYLGLLAGLPTALGLSVIGLIKANSGRIVGAKSAEARKWSNILMLLIAFDMTVLAGAGIWALLPEKANAPVVARRGPGIRRHPSNRPAAVQKQTRLARPPIGIPVTREAVAKTLDIERDFPSALRTDRTALTRDWFTHSLLSMGAASVPKLLSAAKNESGYPRFVSLDILARLADAGQAEIDAAKRYQIENPAVKSRFEKDRVTQAIGQIFSDKREKPLPTMPQQVREIIDKIDLSERKQSRGPPPCTAVLRDGTRLSGVLATPFFRMTADAKQVKIESSRLRHLRFGNLLRGEKAKALTDDGSFRGWINISDVEIDTADGPVTLPRNRIIEIEITDRLTLKQIDDRFGLRGIALAYATAATLDRPEMAKKLRGMLNSHPARQAEKLAFAGQHSFPAEVGLAEIDKHTSLLAAGDDKGQIHLFLLDKGAIIPLATHSIDRVFFKNRPLILGTTAYIGGARLAGADGGLYAVDLLTGTLRWRTPLGNVRYANIAHRGKTLFVTSDGTARRFSKSLVPAHGDAGLYAVDLETGKIKWFVPLEEVTGDQSPIIDAQGILLRVATHRKTGLVFQTRRFQADSGQPVTRVEQREDTGGKETGPAFIWNGLSCRGAAGPNPGSGNGAALICKNGDQSLAFPADTYEPASGEFETAFSVANLLFVGSTVIEVK